MKSTAAADAIPGVSAVRDETGLRIAGSRFALRLSFTVTGDLHVMVEAPAADGRLRQLGVDDLRLYAPLDVRVVDGRLCCLAPDAAAPAFRQGFVIQLEPGMEPLLKISLPTLSAAARLAKTVTRVTEELLHRELQLREEDFLCALVASTALDGVEATLALYRLNAQHPSVRKEVQNRRFLDALTSQPVQALLRQPTLDRAFVRP
jgi:hypothetical protein